MILFDTCYNDMALFDTLGTGCTNSNMKYIMFQTKDGKKIPIIFPNFMVHSMVAERLQDLTLEPNCKVISAGEIKISVSNCSGNSESLKVGVKKGDATIIHEYDYFHGFPNETGVKIS